VVFASAIWGGLSLLGAAQEARRASGLRAAYDAVRYEATAEREAARAALQRPAESRSSFFVAALGMAEALGEARANAALGDLPGIRRLARLQTSAVATAKRLYASEGQPEVAHELQQSLEYKLGVLRRDSGRGSHDRSLRDAGRWPASIGDFVGLLGMGLVFVVGLAVTLFLLLRFAGYRPVGRHERKLEQLQHVALTDNLTGLRNHRAFHEDLSREIERRNRTGSTFAVVMIDLNGLKQLNDTYGHQAGDEKIKALGDCLQASVRGTDCAYRTGGDEFMVLLPGARAWAALTFANRLHGEAGRAEVGISVGITESTRTESRDSLVAQVDIALYEAKRSKLKTVVYNPGLDPKAPEPVRDNRRHHQRVLATALARAVDAKDAGTRNHCETVAAISALIAHRLGLDNDRIERVRLAGLLHDVGKIGIADAILQKPEKLLREERAIMSTHTTIGHAIVSATDLEEEARWVLHHHERWDGAGYPHGLSGEDIPLESRIILVADAFEAITSDRPYRAGRPPEAALEELVAHAGTQFDPLCVAALCVAFDHESGIPTAELPVIATPATEPTADAVSTPA
jgi:diguanylate cyclase (GGDEF)-like protein/putative nucleotidyltransferase with HDIG domain